MSPYLVECVYFACDIIYLSLVCRFGSRTEEPNGESENAIWTLSRTGSEHNLQG